MVKEIIINSASNQTRVAITEDGNLVDFFVDHPESRRMVGDIYLGRIARVLQVGFIGVLDEVEEGCQGGKTGSLGCLLPAVGELGQEAEDFL